jgi:hypothetical protein
MRAVTQIQIEVAVAVGSQMHACRFAKVKFVLARTPPRLAHGMTICFLRI